MNRKISVIALILAAGLLSGCAKTLAATPSTGVSSAAETTAATDVPEEVLEADRLTNHMSENERNSVSEGPLTILEEPWKKEADDPFKNEVMVEFWDSNDYINNSRSCLKRIYNMEDPETISRLQNMIKSYEEYPFPKYLCTGSANGRKVEFLPQEDYDGGKCEVYYLENSDDGSGEGKEQHKKFKDYAAFKKWYRAYLNKQVKDDGLSIIQADQKYDDTVTLWDAVINKTYKTVPCGYIDRQINYHNLGMVTDKSWEFVPSEVETIKDSVKEIKLFDDETCLDFLSHVILPPDYDPDKTYPVLFLTDAVWRFGSCPELWNEMKEGRARPVIIVTLGFDYKYSGSNEYMRGQFFIMEADLLDDFITDNLMPLISEKYKIDCDTSVFYGHSNGGFFADYCLFNSDQYENQPFAKYIIGSPSLWSVEKGRGYGLVEKDYGYWERNDKLEKEVLITVGEHEDPDYEQYYEDRPSTIEGAKLLQQRLEAHGAHSKLKFYDSHHYQYIPEMLKEYVNAFRTR